jgi:O-methyltransferase
MEYTSASSQQPVPAVSSFRGSRIISDQIDAAGLQIIWDTLSQIVSQAVPGHIVEFGCYVGTTSLYLRRLLDATKDSARRELHVYDSFAGLPPKHRADQSSVGNQFQAGALQVSKKELLLQFKKAGLRPPIVHKAWFADLQPADIPSPIGYAFLDGDFYASITDSLRLVWPRLSPGGFVVIDDYRREALPGVERAVDDFFRNKAATIRHRQRFAIISAG